MKILLSNKFFYPRGGDCIHTIQLKKLLEQHGHEVAIFSMQFPINEESQYANYWPSEVSFNSKSPSKLIAALSRPLGDSEVKKKWNQLLKDFQPDIIHLHNIHSQISPIIARIAKEQNIPVVWTLHDYKLLCPAYTFKDFSGKVCEDCMTSPKSILKKRCIKGSLLASILGYLEAKKWNSKKLKEYTNSFIAPSKFLKEKMISGGFSENQIEQLYNFADNDKFKVQVKTVRKNQVVYVGRLSSEKGVETLCRAFQQITDLKLLIIGDGPLRESLEKQYSTNAIEFLGFQPWEFIQKELSEAVCMVIPSEWYENNPLTMIESFALGTPVIGANIGGIPELIDENENGMVFIPGDKDDLFKKIQNVKEKEDWNYQEIQNKAISKFSQDTYYKKLMQLYTLVLVK